MEQTGAETHRQSPLRCVPQTVPNQRPSDRTRVRVGVLRVASKGTGRFMCGIFGYVGRAEKYVDVPGMTLHALRRLEYRGYDSWGIAVRNGKGIDVEKHVGKIGQASTIL